MKFSIGLQRDYSYAIWPLVLLVLGIALIILLYVLKMKKKNMVAQAPVVPQAMPMPKQDVHNTFANPNELKNHYLVKVDKVYKAYKKHKATERDVYLRFSKYVREFATKYTGKDVTKYTLMEFRMQGMNAMADLIEKFYEAEFPKETSVDIEEAYKSTVQVIKSWN